MKAITEQSIRMALLRKELKPGDTVVVEATTVITPAAVSYMREQQLFIARNDVEATRSTNLPTLGRQVNTIQIIDCFVKLLEMCYMNTPANEPFFLAASVKIKQLIQHMSSSESEQSTLKNQAENDKRFEKVWSNIDFTALDRETILYYRLLLKSSQVYLDLLCHDYNEVIVNETFDLVIDIMNELEKKVKKHDITRY